MTLPITASRRILLIEGHPDPSEQRLNHALVSAYADGATSAGHQVRRIAVGALDFPFLKTAEAWNHGTLPPALQPAQDCMAWAEHVVIFFRSGWATCRRCSRRFWSRWYFRAHSVKSLERNILGFVGFAPVHETLIGSVESLGPAGVARWLNKLRKLGAQAT